MAHQRRVFVSLLTSSIGDSVVLSSEDSYHLERVVRIQAGDPLLVVDPESKRTFDAVVEPGPFPVSGMAVKLIREIPSPSLSSRGVTTLLFAHCKGKTNDFICEKATEVGCSRIIIWQAARSIPRFNSIQDEAKRITRWQKLAHEAAKQSARLDVPEVLFARSLSAALHLLPEEQEDSNHPKHQLITCALSSQALGVNELNPLGPQVHLLVGPEGDLTNAEEQELAEFGSRFLTLGSLRLKSETAALYAIGVVNGAILSAS